MYSLEVPTWKNFDENEFDRGIFLWVLHADKIPPHIGISKNGAYFSLKVSGKDEALPVRRVLQLLRSKEIATLMVKTSENSILCKELSTVFDRYERAGTNGFTCLTPVTEIYFSEPRDLILSELLNLLNESGVVETVYGANLPSGFAGIPAYGRSDIQKRLDDLNHAERKKHIPEGH